MAEESLYSIFVAACSRHWRRSAEHGLLWYVRSKLHTHTPLVGRCLAHTCDVGAPFDAVYHGGLEPTPVSGRNEDPSLTLQEGSWSSFGTQNGLPSVNYNYYSPLDDLGQPLPHYHSMRRMHLFLHDFSSEIVRASASTAPDLTPNRTAGAPFDGTTLRWQVRSRPPLRQASTANSTGSTVVLGLDAAPPHQPGFLFVNNHQRLRKLAAHEAVRFVVRMGGSGSGEENSSITIPSRLSPPAAVQSGTWFTWPFFLELGSSSSNSSGSGGSSSGSSDDGGSSIQQLPSLAWATAQVVCRVRSGRSTTIVLAATDDVEPELSFSLPPGSFLSHTCDGCSVRNESQQQRWHASVVRLPAGWGKQGMAGQWREEPVATVTILGGGSAPPQRVSLVVLPSSLADSVWRVRFAGEERVIVSGKKTVSFFHVLSLMIVLPRQARDKHTVRSRETFLWPFCRRPDARRLTDHRDARPSSRRNY